jgi:type I restriction enzyme M protein
VADDDREDIETSELDDDVEVGENELICDLTGDIKKAKPEEETLQAFIGQLRREYRVPLTRMQRDVKLLLELEDPRTGKTKKKRPKVALAVYAHDIDDQHPAKQDAIIRIVVIDKKGSKATAKKMQAFDQLLESLSADHGAVYGVWTNGELQTFRGAHWNEDTLQWDILPELTDFPAPHETLDDLNDATRRPLRLATKEGLVRTFKHCHDYLYGNQQMRGDKAFWQLLYLIFAKIYDEQNSLRRFFVGATEAHDEAGQKRVSKRIKDLFDEVKAQGFDDVFDETDRIELNPRALAYIAGQLGRYSFLGTEADAKGLAYESIISTTLKRERGQFFTPRNVIEMMVRMMNPGPDDKVLDPACGSGGFLVVVLHHVRRRLLEAIGAHPDHPVPSELKAIEADLRDYARAHIFGIDADSDLRKAARMNMIMNNDGHGNIYSFNSLEFGVEDRGVAEMQAFLDRDAGHEEFDFVFANPPFGAKIPIKDPKVLKAFDLGHNWELAGDTWVKNGVQKSVPPEILFIEGCFKFLKPGTGKMAIVLPNGVLGNPGNDKEAVRAWMLRNMELIASVDLPGEAFLPQVSVQASCVFLRRRDPDELRMAGSTGPEQGPVFMAIAEKVGHDRRGKTVTERGPDGRELIYVDEVLERFEDKDGIHEESVRHKRPHVDDDLPWIAEQFLAHSEGRSFDATRVYNDEVA